MRAASDRVVLRLRTVRVAARVRARLKERREEVEARRALADVLRRAARRLDAFRLRKHTVLFFGEFSLCLSRACFGKMIVSIQNVGGKTGLSCLFHAFKSRKVHAAEEMIRRTVLKEEDCGA